MARGCGGLLMGLALTLALARPAFAQEPVRYTVQPGDTLTRIAARFGTTVSAIVEANGLTNPNRIYVGQVLVIPIRASIPSHGRVHIVQPGETLYRIARRYGTTVERLMALNGLNHPSRIFVGQVLQIPEEIPGAPLPWPSPFTEIQVGPAPAIQGRVFPLRVRLSQPATLQATFLDVTYPLAPTAEGGEGLIAVPAMQAPGVYSLTIIARDLDGRTVSVNLPVRVIAGSYGRESLRLPPDRRNLLDPKLIREEREKVLAVCTPFEPERRWSGPFRYPVENPQVTSAFGTRRSYNGGPYSSYHEGLDLRGTPGTPVYAPADGIVVLAESLTVRGNAVILRHGWGVCSGYWHLSAVAVQPGQSVRKGDLLGYVGNTGLSTGAHLHWEIRVRGIPVDPRQWVESPLP
ncbi:LysM peptidoglycan-binding domain-containing M23 family metallopeptidase [Thermoflexus sp.]|uniref:LysM peptidoglycan-binding domain-containing M23 family metallopeptidase n=1 Tax=Thermoflexus sp. TaxID=1969742 RepID=UPI0025CD8B8F|nr:LysM peptidoglycan-binding domain-containing M23 family metallopeptidase [Thermoflexus sp.]MDW8180797.1 LysM peptidoglycan-binding domain-containing M23 family metallopeptidase [Anaerolineae bacterium]MCS6963476.1 LysM peptidoglycan-binding domain-containing M23 family metallopeptidase [Thermoflexus sp.]MCS7351342.1 LysM peptidoglycan-binding domain-containing M23 family metallopeptidase [Thermoflexus sp.]MCX7689214.1 LysM peptidoglycan-binding domain-containing M23 family metallopeptidase [